MEACLSLVLHGHLPFVRHPEHETFLEENWLFEAVTESYLPLLEILSGWQRDGMKAQIALTLSPTLCSMLLDPLLQDRCLRYLDSVVALAEKETFRTSWEPELAPLSQFYLERLERLRALYLDCDRNLVAAFARLQEQGMVEIITCAATHALLPLLQDHPPSLRAQVLAGRDHYRSCFGRDPRGIWLPECAYSEAVEPALQEANIRWCLTDTHGLLHASPRPVYGHFAPVFTPHGLAVFGRDFDSARQVWSKNEGYPGDGRYRDFYRDIGFDLDFDYLKPHLPAPPHRSFTGIKYSAIAETAAGKRAYNRAAALDAAAGHAQHFLEERLAHFQAALGQMDRPPILVCPYDAELFGHWWYEGPEFLDFFARKAFYDQSVFRLASPGAYLSEQSTHQVAQPSPSSWGEDGYWKVWLNDSNEWIGRHLRPAQEKMSALARAFEQAAPLEARALRQAGRELLLAQASDWPFILKGGGSPEYARRKVKTHLARFHQLASQLESRAIDEAKLAQLEWTDNFLPDLDCRYWR